MKIPDEVEEGLLHEWRRHPFTQVCSKQADADLATASKRLANICSVSSDPDVRSAFAEYVAAGRTTKLFSGLGNVDGVKL